MSLDIHAVYPNLIAVGFYDGTVGVYNTAEITTALKYQSSAKNGKHTDPVWQVKWQKDDLDGNMNFFSVSSDGRVVNWTIIKSELLYIDIVTLNMEMKCQKVALCPRLSAAHVLILTNNKITYF